MPESFTSNEVAEIERLVDRAENLVIGIAMGWDLEAMVELVKESCIATRKSLGMPLKKPMPQQPK